MWLVTRTKRQKTITTSTRQRYTVVYADADTRTQTDARHSMLSELPLELVDRSECDHDPHALTLGQVGHRDGRQVLTETDDTGQGRLALVESVGERRHTHTHEDTPGREEGPATSHGQTRPLPLGETPPTLLPAVTTTGLQQTLQ